MTVWTVLRSTAKIFSPTAIKAAFWSAVVYFGPTTTMATLGPVPLAVTIIIMHFGGPELLSLAL
jgi:hypothetical protein